MGAALDRLVRRLQAVAAGAEELPHLLRAQRVATRGQFLGELPRALRRPSQRRHRIAARHRSDQRFERSHQLGIVFLDRRPTSTWSSDVHDLFGAHAAAKFISAGANRRARHPCRALNHRDSSVAELGLGARPKPPHPFVHHRRQSLELAPDLSFVCHADHRSRFDRAVDPCPPAANQVVPEQGLRSRDPCASRCDPWCFPMQSLEVQSPSLTPEFHPLRRSSGAASRGGSRERPHRSAPGHLGSERWVASATPAETAAAATASGSEQ
jgi:hypothetical protein